MSTSTSEARAWIKRAAPEARFAPERFPTAGEALDFVYKIYRAGAVLVSVDDGGGALRVDLPEDTELRAGVLSVCNAERERSGATPLHDRGQRDVVLSWDAVPA